MHYTNVKNRMMKQIKEYVSKIRKYYGDDFLECKLNPKDLYHVLNDLKPLRQACNHYQVRIFQAFSQIDRLENSLWNELRDPFSRASEGKARGKPNSGVSE